MSPLTVAVIAFLLTIDGLAHAQRPVSSANDAMKAVAAALTEASKTGKHVLLANFVVVPVHVGQVVGRITPNRMLRWCGGTKSSRRRRTPESPTS
jgi:hypothetical protein